MLSRLSTPASIAAPTEFLQSKTHIIAKTALPVLSDRGLSLLPTCTFDACPSLDLICVPGSAGVVGALADVETIDFVRRQASNAKYVTSVCTGAFLLGAAGLLKGRRATRIGLTPTCCQWWAPNTRRGVLFKMEIFYRGWCRVRH